MSVFSVCVCVHVFSVWLCVFSMSVCFLGVFSLCIFSMRVCVCVNVFSSCGFKFSTMVTIC